MPTTTIQSRLRIRRKNGAFVGGELLSGELGLDTANDAIYGSVDGTTVTLLAAAEGASIGALTDLSDVQISSLADKDIIWYNNSANRFENVSFEETGFAPSDHTHTSSDITDLATFITNHSDVSANTAARHSHANKAVIDDITAAGSGAIITSAERTKLSGIEAGATADQNASEVSYSNATSGLTATDVQAAIDELEDTKSDQGHTHTTASITDFDASVEEHPDVSANTTARHTHSNKSTLDAITDEGSGQIITAGERTLVQGAIQSSEKGAVNGVATLGSDQKIPTSQIPDAVLGQLEYQGVWNADTNSPDLAGSDPRKGDYYKVSEDGSTNPNAGIGGAPGYTDWRVGDWVVYNGSYWDKIDNTESVPSVFGRTGAIEAQADDYSATLIENDSAVSGATVAAALNTLNTGKADTSHTHNASDITAGDLAAARMSLNVAEALAASPDTIIFDAGTL